MQVDDQWPAQHRRVVLNLAVEVTHAFRGEGGVLSTGISEERTRERSISPITARQTVVSRTLVGVYSQLRLADGLQCAVAVPLA
ncbi:hypothetical protein HDA40_001773 [Hamadaea flava]|uniref:Uncharacterized protein n=1 Tax=Hamadaea flava TaxID=1742688 RepID=A0ABV8LMD7_9ACTN|nr:hypothetical protein [Hamadaea flava]MCP2323266.1 hypothetical protein [Hamadaea flava]